MKRRSYLFEILQVLLCIGIFAATVMLFIDYIRYRFLFPAVFGTAALTAFLYAFEGVWYNKNLVTGKKRIVIFLVLSVLLVLACVLSVRVIYF